MKHGIEAFDKIIDLHKKYKFKTMLDVGSGLGGHAKAFKAYDIECITVDSQFEADFKGDYLDYIPNKKFDCVWSCHMLEHCVNPNLILTTMFDDLKDGGFLALTVPLPTHKLVLGHCNSWTTGQLLYNLILAGFDCRDAMVNLYDNNISIIVKKKKAVHEPLVMGKGDYEKIKHLFPKNICFGIGEDIKKLNWS